MSISLAPQRSVAGALMMLFAASAASAQSNTIAGLNVKMGDVSNLTALGRTGTFPTGMNGLAMNTTSCNIGSVDVPWLQAMQENHPFIAFMVCRETNGRFTQISDRSFVKHGFFALSNNQCTPCQHPSNGTFLGVGCSDTYSIGNNGDSFWLAPPDEIDPWLGKWTAACSHFDKGEPAVTGPAACDSIRSLTTAQVTAMGPVAHRIHVSDADLSVPNSTFYFQGQYVIQAEAESNRFDNVASRQFTPAWTGSAWSVPATGGMLQDSVLFRWSGATVRSSKNGTDDGRVYVAVKVTGPTNGLYHYEYAVHNRDNKRGVGSFSIPSLPCTTVANVFFKDVDADPSNDWTLSQTDGAITFSTANNPIRWNSLFNFAFDSNTAPAAAASVIGEFDAGAGAPSFTVPSLGPSVLPNTTYGNGTPGCNGPHNLCAEGPAQIGDASFVLTCDRGPASSLGLALISNAQDAPGTDYFGVDILLHSNPFGTELYAVDVPTDATGLGTFSLFIPNNPAFQGLHYYASVVYAWTGIPCSPGLFGLSSSRGLDIAVQ